MKGIHNENVGIYATSEQESQEPYNLYTQASFLARQRLQMGCSPPHLTFRRRHGSHEKALFLVARAELAVVVLLWLLVPLPLFPLPLEVPLDADAILTHSLRDVPLKRRATDDWREGRSSMQQASSRRRRSSKLVAEPHRTRSGIR